MLGLVLAPSLLQTFVFWELVGLSSFLLIGFYYQKDAAVSASKKAFIVTRFADLGFLLGIMLLGVLGYQAVANNTAVVFPFDFSYLNSPQLLWLV